MDKSEEPNPIFEKAIGEIINRYGNQGIVSEICLDISKVYDQHTYLTENAYYVGLYFLLQAIWEDEPWEEWGKLFQLVMDYKTFLKDTNGSIIAK